MGILIEAQGEALVKRGKKELFRAIYDKHIKAMKEEMKQNGIDLVSFGTRLRGFHQKT